MIRVLLATRLSRIQNSNESGNRIDRDDEQAESWAQDSDRRIVLRSKDPGVSGAMHPAKRKDLGKYLTRPELYAQFDEIAASSVDRLSRKVADIMWLQDWCNKHGKRLRIKEPDLEWPTNDPMMVAMWQLLGTFAELERNLTKKRYEDMRNYLRDNESLVGKAPWGFRISGDRGKKTLEPDPELLPYLQGMIERALRGDTLLAIAKWLDSEGITPVQGGNGWSPTSVQQILRNPALKGVRYAEEQVPGKKYARRRTNKVLVRWDNSVLSAGEFAALQAELDKRSKRRGLPEDHVVPFLTGSLRCGLCDGPMYMIRSATRRKDGTTTYTPYYRCKGLDNAPSKCKNLVRQDDVEPFVDSWFTEDGPFAKVETVETVTVPGDDHAAEIADVEAELRALNFRDPNFLELQRKVLAELQRLEALPSAPAQVTERPTGVTVGEVWSGLSVSAKRKFLLATGMEVKAVSAKRYVPKPLTSAAEARKLTEQARQVPGFVEKPPSTKRSWLFLQPPQVTGHYSVSGDPTHITEVLKYQLAQEQ